MNNKYGTKDPLYQVIFGDMKDRMAKVKWLRLPNLFLVGVTQFILYYLFVKRALIHHSIESRLDNLSLFFLVMVTIIIALTGYMINDYYDEKIDLINHPNEPTFITVLGKYKTSISYITLVLSGLLLSYFIALQTNLLGKLWIYPTAIILLYFYSRYFKYRPFIGNLIVSLFCAGVIYIVYFAELASIKNLFFKNEITYKTIQYIFYFYCLFAVITNYLRELIKDIEDLPGDQSHGAKTFPIVFGIKNTGYFVHFLSIILVIILIIWIRQDIVETSIINVIYIIFLIIFPILYINWSLSKKTPDYYRISTLTKMLMLAGLINLLFYFQQI